MKATFINSLPKAGTNLLAKCLLLLGYSNAGHIGSGFVLNNRSTAILKRLALTPIRQGYLVGIDTPVELARRPVDWFLSRITNYEFITAHVGYTSDLMFRVIELDYAPIVITRDPRAVLASFVPYVTNNARHTLHSAFAGLTEEDRYLHTLTGKKLQNQYLQPLRVRCAALDPWIQSNAVLHVRFEDLIGSKGGGSDEKQREMLDHICHWIEAPTTDSSYVLENLFGPGERTTFRTGQIDSWKSEIPESVSSHLEDALGDIIDKWGYR